MPEPKGSKKQSDSHRETLMAAKVAFAQQALKEVQFFMEKDNQMISHFEEIIRKIKDDMKTDPDRFYRLSGLHSKDVSDINMSGGDIFTDLFGLIKDVVVKDKDLVVRIIEKIFDL